LLRISSRPSDAPDISAARKQGDAVAAWFNRRNSTAKKELAMTARSVLDENKRLVTEFYELAINKQKPDEAARMPEKFKSDLLHAYPAGDIQAALLSKEELAPGSRLDFGRKLSGGLPERIWIHDIK
jgi:hypothetical protein